MTVPPPDPAAGVFETLLVRRGRAVELEPHLARLAASATALFDWAPNGRADVLAAARGVPLGRLRVTVTPDHHRELRVARVPPEQVFPTQRVRLVPLVVRGGLGPHKWADRRLLEAAEQSAGAAVPLLVDEDGSVLEASRANVFACERGTLVTPPADGRILPGVTRARILALAPVREEELSLERLQAADEVFLSGSVRGIEPVRRGPVTEALAGRLARAWEGGG